MKITKQQQQQMLELAKPLIDWLNSNADAHCCVRVDQNGIELVQGVVFNRLDCAKETEPRASGPSQISAAEEHIVSVWEQKAAEAFGLSKWPENDVKPDRAMVFDCLAAAIDRNRYDDPSVEKDVDLAYRYAAEILRRTIA